jgi:asparagine synthase (glutamine-hydrolysing)
LRDDARAAVTRAYYDFEAGEPARWTSRLRWWWRLRHIQIYRHHCALVAADVGTQVSHPLIDAAFLAALGPWLSRRKITSRTDAMHALFGHVLPPEIRTRPTKATFWQPFWNRPSEAFAAAWDGTGVDETLVDVDGLRETWTSGNPNVRTLMLLQAAWLRRRRDGESSARHGVDQDASRFGNGLPVTRPAELPAG